MMRENETARARPRTAYLDVLNVTACFFVIVLHTNGMPFTSRRVPSWWLVNAVQCLCYCAVPVFYMIAGAVCMDYRDRYDTPTYFRHRFQKVLFPYLAWGGVSLLGMAALERLIALDAPWFRPVSRLLAPFTYLIRFDDRTFCGILNRFLHPDFGLFGNSTFTFILRICTIYLALPILSLIPRGKRLRAFSYIICSSFLLNSLMPLIGALSGGALNWNPVIAMPLGGSFILYALLGYVLTHFSIPRPVRAGVYVSGLFGLALLMAGSKAGVSTKILGGGGGQDVSFLGYDGPACILYSAAFFLLFKQLSLRPRFGAAAKMFSPFRKQTYGIYLFHILLIGFFRNFIPIDWEDCFSYLPMTIAIFFSTWLTVFLLQRIPWVRRLVP